MLLNILFKALQQIDMIEAFIVFRLFTQLLGQFAGIQVFEFFTGRWIQIMNNRPVGESLANQGGDGGKGFGGLGQDVIAQYGIDDGAFAGGEGTKKGYRKFRRLESFQPGSLAIDIVLKIVGCFDMGGSGIIRLEQAGKGLDIAAVIHLFHGVRFPVSLMSDWE